MEHFPFLKGRQPMQRCGCIHYDGLRWASAPVATLCVSLWTARAFRGLPDIITTPAPAELIPVADMPRDRRH
jgi:hypothetical protein